MLRGVGAGYGQGRADLSEHGGLPALLSLCQVTAGKGLYWERELEEIHAMALGERTRNRRPCLCGDTDTGVIMNMLALCSSPSALLSGRMYFYVGMWPTLN